MHSSLFLEYSSTLHLVRFNHGSTSAEMYTAQVGLWCPCPNPDQIKIMVSEPCVVFLLNSSYLLISLASPLSTRVHISQGPGRGLPLSEQKPTVPNNSLRGRNYQAPLQMSKLGPKEVWLLSVTELAGKGSQLGLSVQTPLVYSLHGKVAFVRGGKGQRSLEKQVADPLRV